MNFHHLLIVALILTIAYIYSMIIAPSLVNNQMFSKLNQLHESCIIKCGNLPCNISDRGNKYYIGSDKNADGCYVTFWGMTHFLLYAILGYLYPHRFLEFSLIGVLFELYEKRYYDC